MQAPWCFTLDPHVRMDLCDIHPCSKYYNAIIVLLILTWIVNIFRLFLDNKCCDKDNNRQQQFYLFFCPEHIINVTCFPLVDITLHWHMPMATLVLMSYAGTTVYFVVAIKPLSDMNLLCMWDSNLHVSFMSK